MRFTTAQRVFRDAKKHSFIHSFILHEITNTIHQSLHHNFIIAIIAPSSTTATSPTPKTPASAGPSSAKTPLRPHTPPRPPIENKMSASDDQDTGMTLLSKEDKTSSQHFLFPSKATAPEIKLVKNDSEKKSKSTDRRNACTILKVPKPESISKDGLVYGMFHNQHHHYHHLEIVFN